MTIVSATPMTRATFRADCRSPTRSTTDVRRGLSAEVVISTTSKPRRRKKSSAALPAPLRPEALTTSSWMALRGSDSSARGDIGGCRKRQTNDPSRTRVTRPARLTKIHPATFGTPVGRERPNSFMRNSLDTENHDRSTRKSAPTRRVSGKGGIRTRGAVTGTHAFQACQFNHSCTFPKPRIYAVAGSWPDQVAGSAVSTSTHSFPERPKDSYICRLQESATFDPEYTA
jgi:hypothetical protein